MYTRCPACQTVFRLTAAQLKAHGGKVRCGRCQHVFQAEQHLVERREHTPAKPAARAPSKPESAARKRAARKGPRPAAQTAAASLETLLQPPQPEDRAAAEPPAATMPPFGIPQGARNRLVFWVIGSLALLFVLAGQVAVFYGQELVRELPFLQGPVQQLCTVLPCKRLAPVDMRKLDLLETRVTPHPRYDRALRVRATIVNRAERAQPYPLLEISLIDSQGHLVARRVYPPREYMSNPGSIPAGLPPQVAVHIGLDITSPGPKASGFEVLLLPPSE